MLPRNLTFFRFSTDVAAQVWALADANVTLVENALDAHRFREIGPMEFSTSGFVNASHTLTTISGNYEGFALRIAEKLLPSASVREAVAKKCDIIESLEGRKPGAKERKRIKDDVINEMLPHAPVRLKTVRGWFDYAEGWLVIDTASRKQAEYVLTQLRQALGSLPAVPLAPEHAVRLMLTGWLAFASDNVNNVLPPGYELGSECQMRDAASTSGARVTFAAQDLETDEVRDHLRTGKQVHKIGAVFDDRISMVLDADLVVRKFKLTDVVLEEQFEREEFGEQSDFALVTLEVSRLCASLARVFKVPRP